MNPIDKILRQRLKHHHQDVPPHLWEQIEARLPQSRNVFKPVFSIIALLIIAALFGLTFYEISIFESNNTNNLVQADHLVSEIGSDLKEKNSKTENPLFTPVSRYISKEHNSQTKENPNEINSAQNPIAYNPSFIAKDPSLVRTHIAESDSEITSNLENQNSLDELANAEEENILQNIQGEADKTYPDADNEKAVHFMEMASISVIKQIKLKSLDESYSSYGVLPGVKFNTIQQNCPSFRYSPGGVFAEVYYASDFNNRNMKGDDNSKNYLLQREQSESSIYSFSSGLRFGYHFNSKVSVRSGLDFRWINEKFDYIDPESNQTRLVTIKDYVYQNGRIVDSIITQEVVIIPGAVKYTVYNTIRSLDIPVLFSYNVFNAGKLSAALTAGPVINLRTYQKGMILSPSVDGNTIALSDNNNDGLQVYKSFTGLSLSAMLSLQYRLNSDFDFVFEPGIRQQMNSITSDDFPIQQNFTTLSLATGIRYNF